MEQHNQLAPQDKAETLRKAKMRETREMATKTVESMQETLAGIGIQRERYARSLVEAIYSNPDILTANKPSLAQAFRRCCMDGFVPDNRQAAIAVFNGKATYMPMKDGLIQLAYQSLGLRLRAGVVHKGDHYVLRRRMGEEPIVEHEPDLLAEENGEIIGAFCYYKMADDQFGDLNIWTRHRIMQVRAAAKAQKGPWVNFPDQMIEKSIIKSTINALRGLIASRLEGSRLMNILEADTEAEIDESDYMVQVSVPDMSEDAPPPSGRVIDNPPPDEKPAKPKTPKAAKASKPTKAAPPPPEVPATPPPPPEDDLPPDFNDDEQTFLPPDAEPQVTMNEDAPPTSEESRDNDDDFGDF